MTAEDKPGWQPIESAPRDGTRVLAWTAYETVEIVSALGRGDSWDWFTDDGLHVEVTHWQPLPAPPGARND